MAYSLYLVVVDNTGTVVPGGSTDLVRPLNPFRNTAVDRPFELLSYSFDADAPASTGGAPIGKVDVGELVVTMADDRAAGVLFRAAASGRQFRSIDVLVLQNGERPGLVAGVGVGSAVLTGISWGVSPAGLQRTLRVDGRIFSVGSAYQKPDGTYSTFDIGTYNTGTGATG